MSGARDLVGWVGSGMVAAGLFAGVAVVSLKALDAPSGVASVQAVALDLSVGVVAMAEAVPSVPPAVPQTVHTDPPQPPEADVAPRLPLPEPEPSRAAAVRADPKVMPEALALPVTEEAPVVEPPVAAPEEVERSLDMAQSPRPRKRIEATPPDRAQETERAVADTAAEQASEKEVPEREPTQASAAQAAGAEQAAQPAPIRREAGGRDAARYGDMVMRQIARLRRAKAPDRGVVTVGFEVGTDGGLRRVTVVASSGSAALDRVAVDHIRRAAPFPPPPEGAATRFAFEFVGR